MTNWCVNKITIGHNEIEMVDKLVTGFYSGNFFNEFIPVPLEIRNTDVTLCADPTLREEQIWREANNLERWGYGDWYDFCVSEWGTCWDVGGFENIQGPYDGKVILDYDTAWAPPLKFYEKMRKQGFVIDAAYYIPASAVAGRWHNGENKFFEFAGMDSQQVKKIIPLALDKQFEIVKGIQEWEQWYEQSLDCV